MVVNVGHPEGSTKLHKALAATMRAAFGSDRVFRDDSEPTNTMLLATTTDADPASSLHAAAVTVPSELGSTLDEAADRLTVYYGGADTVVCMAHGHLSELLAFVRS